MRLTPQAQAYLELVYSLGYFSADSKEELIELQQVRGGWGGRGAKGPTHN